MTSTRSARPDTRQRPENLFCVPACEDVRGEQAYSTGRRYRHETHAAAVEARERRGCSSSWTCEGGGPAALMDGTLD